MKQIINTETWERKDMYNFFKDFVNPTCSVTSEVECTNARLRSKSSGRSFFVICLYAIIKAANEIKELRYRIDANRNVLLYDSIDALTPVKVNEQGKFVSVRIPFHPNFEIFYQEARLSINSVSTESNPYSEEINPKTKDVYSQLNISVTPDLYFTSVTATQQYPHGNNFPLVNVGKIISRGDKLFIPIAINIHHGLADGHHISQFLKRVEEIMKDLGS